MGGVFSPATTTLLRGEGEDPSAQREHEVRLPAFAKSPPTTTTAVPRAQQTPGRSSLGYSAKLLLGNRTTAQNHWMAGKMTGSIPLVRLAERRRQSPGEVPHTNGEDYTNMDSEEVNVIVQYKVSTFPGLPPALTP